MRRPNFDVLICAAIVAATPVEADEDHGPVDSARYVSVGGIEQWVTIKGEDRGNTPVLFIHGGPGDALSPFSEKLLADWESHFTLIQWDQPGAGRTFAKTGPEIAPALSIDRIVRDGIAVAELALDDLGHDKLILLGASWGSIVGARMARERPDLFHAYIGVSQVVSMRRAVAHAYNEALGRLERAGNVTALADLESIGPPPWSGVHELAMLLGHIRAMRDRPAPDLSTFVGSDFGPADFETWLAADEFSQLHFFGASLDGELMTLDLLDESSDFSVPVYVIQGSDDLIAPAVFAEEYVGALGAPFKKFVRIDGGGHELLLAEPDQVLIELMVDDFDLR